MLAGVLLSFRSSEGSERMTSEDAIAQARAGMEVRTADGQKLGTVAEVWYSTDPTAQDPQCDEAVCSRLEVYHGFLVHRVLYVPVRVIAAVAHGHVTLTVDAATVNEQAWGTEPAWIAAAETGRPLEAPDDLSTAPTTQEPYADDATPPGG
jgi:hypothetical protein